MKAHHSYYLGVDNRHERTGLVMLAAKRYVLACTGAPATSTQQFLISSFMKSLTVALTGTDYVCQALTGGNRLGREVKSSNSNALAKRRRIL